MRFSICRTLTIIIATLTLAALPVFAQSSEQKRLEEAAVQLEETLKSTPGNGEAASRLVAVLRELAAAAINSDPERALAHLIRAKELEPANHEVLFEFAMAALRLMLHEDAARALVEALARRPDEPKFLYALARARMGTGDLNDAERLFRRYTELRPDDPTGHFGWGYVLAGMKRNEAARVAFERSLALRPEQTESHYQLGLLDLADGDLDAAAARFGKVTERYRDHTGALLGMGKVYFSRKQYDAARQNLERVVALEPGLQQAHYHLSMTYARLGDKAAAAREAEISERLEREEKNRRRTILRLYEPTENVRPEGERKP